MRAGQAIENLTRRSPSVSSVVFADGIRGGESPARPMRSDCLRELLHGEPPRALEPLAFRPHVGHR